MNITCIICPNGCRLSLRQEGDETIVQGAKCKKGIDFAKTELLNPMRSLTSTVATVFPEMPRLPVKTKGEIPKGKMFEAMEIIRNVIIDKRLKAGDIVLPDVFGTEIIATADIP